MIAHAVKSILRATSRIALRRSPVCVPAALTHRQAARRDTRLASTREGVVASDRGLGGDEDHALARTPGAARSSRSPPGRPAPLEVRTCGRFDALDPGDRLQPLDDRQLPRRLRHGALRASAFETHRIESPREAPEPPPPRRIARNRSRRLQRAALPARPRKPAVGGRAGRLPKEAGRFLRDQRRAMKRPERRARQPGRELVASVLVHRVRAPRSGDPERCSKALAGTPQGPRPLAAASRGSRVVGRPALTDGPRPMRAAGAGRPPYRGICVSTSLRANPYAGFGNAGSVDEAAASLTCRMAYPRRLSAEPVPVPRAQHVENVRYLRAVSLHSPGIGREAA